MSHQKTEIELKNIKMRPGAPARAVTEASSAWTKTTLATIAKVDETKHSTEGAVRPPLQRSWSEKLGQYLQNSIETFAFANGAPIEVYYAQDERRKTEKEEHEKWKAK